MVAHTATMVQPGSPAVPWDPQQAPAAPPDPHTCPVCAALGLAAPQLLGLAQVDRRHTPPVAISHAIFSRAGGPVPHQQPGDPRGSSPTLGCITYTLQQVMCCTLVLTGSRMLQAVPRADTFPVLLTEGGSNPAIDRSPTPAIAASWALYEEEEEEDDMGLRQAGHPVGRGHPP